MRRKLTFPLLLLCIMALVGCNKEMTPLTADYFKVNPSPLEAKGGMVNATVTGTDSVGAVAGHLYHNSGLIENCHVIGSIKIVGNTNVGGIVGKYYAKVTNCSVIGDGAATSYVKGVNVGEDLEGDNIGGIMGHGGENNTLSGNVVKNITVSGTRKVGGVVGIVDQYSDVLNCVVEGVVIETAATVDYATAKASSMSIGGLIGQYNTATSGVEDAMVTGCTVKDVIFNNVNNVTVSIGAIVGGARSSGGVIAPADSVVSENNTIENVIGTNNTYLV